MRRQTVASFLLLGSIALLLSVVGPASAANQNSRVFPVGSTPYNHTYSEWSAAWWQYAYSVPAPSNPLFDTTGANCAVGQSGPVFFLVGVLNTSGTANRDCSVPAGKALFFPILNQECDNIGVDPPLTVPQLQAQCKTTIDAASNLSATLDGTPITGLASYRVQSPVFSVTFPDNNVFQALGFDVPAGTYTPFVSDGIFLMLKSLSAGAHTLHFAGEFPNFALDITYHLNVGN